MKFVCLRNRKLYMFSFFMIVFLSILCNGSDDPDDNTCPKIDQIDVTRADYIPSDAVKITPATDAAVPVLHLTSEYYPPEPLDSTINTAGAEDSPFYDPSNSTLYFWFTPDVDIPVEEQVTDPSTGIYMSPKNGSGWTAPERLWLFDVDSLEGCAFVSDNEIWYCAAVCGTSGLKLFYSEFSNNSWSNGTLDDVLNEPDYQMGEFHITSDGNTVYYHSGKTDGQGGLDLWKIEKTGDIWGSPENVAELNTAGNEGFPFVTSDGNELWFSGDSRIDNNSDGTPDYYMSIFRSAKNGDSWSAPEEVVSQLIGEPTLDQDGNVYFTHHFFENNVHLEADIYVIRKR